MRFTQSMVVCHYRHYQRLILFGVATEAIDVLVARISNYFKTHLVLNEPVRMPFDDGFYEGIVSVAPGFETIDQVEKESADKMTDNNPPSWIPPPTASYRISINQGQVIMTGACCSPSDVM